MCLAVAVMWMQKSALTFSWLDLHLKEGFLDSCSVMKLLKFAGETTVEGSEIQGPMC